MDTYLATSVSSDLSESVAIKHLDLIETLRFVKPYFKSSEFPQNDGLTLPSMPRITQEDQLSADGNNNNNNDRADILSTSSTKGIPELSSREHCLCSNLQSVCVIPRSLDISTIRKMHFTRLLLGRMLAADNQKFAVFMSDFLIKEHSGWLQVDDSHKYYGVIADCLFCLFENENSTASLMTLVLNGSTSQHPDTESADNLNAFTITIEKPDNILFFCATSTKDKFDWIRWLNVGAQLPFVDLISSIQSKREEKSTQTSEELAADRRNNFRRRKSRPLSLIQQVSITEEDLGQSDNQSQSEAVELDPIMIPTTSSGNRPTTLIDMSGVNMRKPKATTISRSESTYDWTQDQGTTRHFPTTKQLEKESRLRKAATISEGMPASHNSMQLRQKRRTIPGYIQPKLLATRSLTNDTYSPAPEKPTRWGSKLIKRASSFFSGKSDSFKLSSTESLDEDSRTSQNARSFERKKAIHRSLAYSKNTSSVTTVDMAGLCEIQGYLLYKRLLKWTSYYCCVYNGTFSCFKDADASLPELQCRLHECQVTPIDDKKAKRPFVFKLAAGTKSAVFSAVSDTDLHSWYTVFNNHIKGALALSKHRGGAFPLWEWSGYCNEQQLTSFVAEIYNEYIDEEFDSDEDLPMVEKMSADGASHHSNESDNQQQVPQTSNRVAEFDFTDSKVAVAERSLSDTELDDSSTKKNTPLDISGLLLPGTKEAAIMRSASESEYNSHHKPLTKPRHKGREKSLAHFQCKSVDDIPSHRSSCSSSSGDEGSMEASGSKAKLSSQEQRKHLIDRMKREKLKIEQALQQKQRKDEEEQETEILVNMTKLQQRRVSTKLKYDFLEKKLQEKREDKSRYSGMFQKSHKHEKTIKQVPPASSADKGDQHIRKQMEELKHKMDTIEKGLVEAKSKHTSTVNKRLNNQPQTFTDSISKSASTTADTLSQHRLRGLESIIETLENPKHNLKSTQSPPHSMETVGDLRKNNNYVKRASEDSKDPPEIRPETLAVINEFETMTRELLARRPSINYEDP